MKKLLLFLIPLTAYAGDNFLSYQFNENVTITISNIECKVPTYKAKFPYSVVAKRIDGQFIFGCFTHDKDDIVIQWAGGDKSVFPANYFLMMKPDT